MRLIVGGLVDTSAVANWTPLRVALTAVENSGKRCYGGSLLGRKERAYADTAYGAGTGGQLRTAALVCRVAFVLTAWRSLAGAA